MESDSDHERQPKSEKAKMAKFDAELAAECFLRSSWKRKEKKTA